MWQTVQMGQTITADMCVKMVEFAAHSCQPIIAATQPAPAISPGDGLASLSTAFMYGSLLLGALALIGAIAWGFVVKVWAEKEARQEAQKCANALIEAWLANQAPGIVRQFADNITRPTLGDGDDAAADEIGESAG